MSRNSARLEIPAREEFLAPAADFLLSFAEHRGCVELERLNAAATAAISIAVENSARGHSDTAVAIEVFETGGKLCVEICNRGLPVLLDGPSSVNAAYFEKFQAVRRHADYAAAENRGREGQVIVFEFSLAAAGSAQPETLFREIPEDEVCTIRRLCPGEETALSRLFYLVYGYDYINEVVYYPDKLKAMLLSGDLVSIVAARPNGRLVGHVGLLRRGRTPPVYEAAMGVNDPAVKSRGLFGKVFQKAIETAHSMEMRYCLFDFVTNHDRSQRHIAKYGTCDMAVYVGCQSRETQARLDKLGMGADPEGMDRYSLLVSIIPMSPRPFGGIVSLPESIGGNYGFLLKPLGLEWTPASRFEALPGDGVFSAKFQEEQSSVVFDMSKPGRGALTGVLRDWRALLRDGYQYAAVDVPADASGLGELREALSENGFFGAGFVPYRMSDKLGFRFQAVGPVKVAFDKIRIAGESGRRLLALVREEHDAVQKI
ncbi:MAG: hypothetical protein WCW52_03330 [Elusimicrobiales bacterium]|jgi:hypothetical protein